MTGWRTALVAFLITVFGALQGFLQAFDFSEQTMGWITMGIGGVMFILRSITSTPMFSKESNR